jgi:poly(ADP-ribose) glycohydrolase
MIFRRLYTTIPMADILHLCRPIPMYCPTTSKELHTMIGSHVGLTKSVEIYEDYSQKPTVFFDVILPSVVRAARIFRGNSFIYAMDTTRHEFSPEECHTIIACMFLGLLKEPYNFSKKSSKNVVFPHRSFRALLTSTRPTDVQKLVCILHYFYRMSQKLYNPNRKVIIQRHSIDTDACSLVANTPLVDFTMYDTPIESHVNCVHVDFANEFLGGGVLNRGVVQEEIMFVLSPEALVGVALCERMNDTESIAIVGTECFSTGVGYARSFCFNGDYRDDRVDRIIIAIDALDMNNLPPNVEFAQILHREHVKAFAGFSHPLIKKAVKEGKCAGVATGNWGCGAFGGDPVEKAILQWVAASQCNLEIRYCHFNDKRAVVGLPPLLVYFRAQETPTTDLLLSALQNSLQ